MAQSIASYIAVRSGVRQFADANAIEDDPYHSVKVRFAILHSATLSSSAAISAGNFSRRRKLLDRRKPDVLVHVSD